MGRPRKIPDATEFSRARNRLWQWLVAHAGADVQNLAGPNKGSVQIPDEPVTRRMEASRIESEAAKAGDPARTRAGAAARAFIDLEFSAAQRKAANKPTIPTTVGKKSAGKKSISKKLSYLDFRAKAIDKATETAQGLTALRALARDLTAWAGVDYQRKFPDGKPGWVPHHPSELAAALADLDGPLAAALGVVTICRTAFETMGDSVHVWGSDLDPTMLHKLEDTALHLADGGFSIEEIAELLGKGELADVDGTEPENWKKVVQRARKKTGQRKKIVQRARGKIGTPAHGAPPSLDRGAKAADDRPHARRTDPRAAPPPRRRSRRG